MILQLREIFQIEGMHLPVDYTISLEELSEVRGYTFAAPVSVQGEFSNRAGIVTLKYTVSCTLDAVCDRCLAELRRDYSYDFSHTVVTVPPERRRHLMIHTSSHNTTALI